MPVTSSWDDNAHTIIRNDFVPPWTWPEMVKISLESVAKIAQLGEQRGDIIANGWANLPPGNAMDAFRQVDKLPNNLGLLVLVAPAQSSLGRILINSYLRMPRLQKTARKIIFVSTLEDARALIVRDRNKNKS